MERLLIPVSMITFLLLGYDKFQAKNNGWRIPEKSATGLVFLVEQLVDSSACKPFTIRRAKITFGPSTDSLQSSKSL